MFKDKKNPQPLQKQHNKENQQEQDKKAQQSKLKLSPGNNNTKDTACKELQQQPPPLNHQQQKALCQQPQQQPESDFEQHQHQLKIQEENEQKWQQQIHSNVDSVSYQQQPHLHKPKETHSTRPEYQHGQKHQLQQQPNQDFQPSSQGDFFSFECDRCPDKTPFRHIFGRLEQNRGMGGGGDVIFELLTAFGQYPKILINIFNDIYGERFFLQTSTLKYHSIFSSLFK